MVTKLLLIDDREAIREGFKLLLHTQPDLKVIADVATPMEAYDLVGRGEIQVVAVSQDLVGVGGAAVTRELVRRQPRVKVMVLAIRCDEDAVREALAAGARGYVLRQQTAQQVFDAI
ncbi:MAG: Transcriptional regulator DegU LuxR family, partial [bacterium]|nr:Transcriptional regulator DegU LuxR family [bacterium]